MEKSISFSALGVRIEIHLVSYICNSVIVVVVVPMPFQIFLAFHLALFVGRVFLCSCSKFVIE